MTLAKVGGNNPTPDWPGQDAENVASLPYNPSGGLARAVYVGVTGTVVLVTLAGNTTTFYNVPAGTIIPVCFTQITAASTASELTAIG